MPPESAPPDPEREFTLFLDGLARGDVPIPPLRIRFKPVRRTSGTIER